MKASEKYENKYLRPKHSKEVFVLTTDDIKDHSKLVSLEAKIEALRSLQISIGSICVVPEAHQYATAVDWSINNKVKEAELDLAKLEHQFCL